MNCLTITPVVSRRVHTCTVCETTIPPDTLFAALKSTYLKKTISVAICIPCHNQAAQSTAVDCQQADNGKSPVRQEGPK